MLHLGVLGKKLYLQFFSVGVFFVVYTSLQVFLALKTPKGISPDEVYHVNTVLYFATHSLLPFIKHQEGSFYLGDLTRATSILYHYLLSLPLRAFLVFSDGSSTIYFLRLLNVGLAILNLSILFKTVKSRVSSQAITVSSLLFFVTPSMFFFLSAFVSYDNLLLTASLLLLAASLKLKDNADLTNLLQFLAVCLFGALVKFSFLPLALITGLVLVKYVAKSLRSLRELGPDFVIRHKLLVSAFVLLFASFVERYVVNVLQFGTISPTCDAVHTVDECMQNAVYARDHALLQAHNEVAHTPRILLAYGIFWVKLMYKRMFGVFGHKVMPPPNIDKYWLVADFAFILSVLRLRVVEFIRQNGLLLLVPIIYAFVLFFYVNYPTFLNTGLWGLAVQGRYILPIWPFVTLLYAKVLSKANKYLIIGVTIVNMVVLVLNVYAVLRFVLMLSA